MNNQSYKWDAPLYQKSSSFQYQLGIMAIDRLKPINGEYILEIGSGNGALTIDLAKKNPNGKITAIEISKEQCEQAKFNIKESGISNIQIICMDALSISYENGFDAVYSNSAIHWIKDLESMYKLLFRALKPGGRIMIQTGLKAENIIFQLLLEMTYDYRESLKGFTIPWRFLNKRQNEKILKEAGFQEIKVEPYEFTMYFKTEEDLLNYWRAAGLVPYLSLLPEEKKEEFIGDFKNRFIRMNQPNPLEYKMMRAFIYAKK
ncbi:MAG: class I SAM-dependent methyltransferase [Promethearchaeota archaeon]